MKNPYPNFLRIIFGFVAVGFFMRLLIFAFVAGLGLTFLGSSTPWFAILPALVIFGAYLALKKFSRKINDDSAHQSQRDLLFAVTENPGISYEQLRDLLGIDQDQLSSQVRVYLQNGMIRQEIDSDRVTVHLFRNS